MGDIISGNRRIDTAALDKRAARAASGLASLGVVRGDIIALFSDGVAKAHNPRDLNAGRLTVMGGFASHLFWRGFRAFDHA